MSDDPTTSPLADLAAGGALGQHGGVTTALHYGDPDGEYRALTAAAGLVDLSFKSLLRMTGADRQRFLGGLASCEVKELAAGEGRYGFVPNHQGKVLADLVVLADDEALWLELPPGSGEAMRRHLTKYIITDRVEVEAVPEWTTLALVGDAAAAVLGELAELPGEGWSHHAVELAGCSVQLARRPLLGRAAFTLRLEAARAAELATALLARPGVELAGAQALDRLRVEAGIPAFGIDFDADCLPQETGLEEIAVSYTKGCYLGQEIIARLHYRGQANRAMRRLLFDGAAPPTAGSRLMVDDGADGRDVGRVGSAVASPAAGHAIGLAIVHRHGNAPGTRLEVEGGGTAEVAELAVPEA